MVLNKHGHTLYNGVCELIAEHLDNLAAEKVIPAFPTGASQEPTHQIQEAEMLLNALRYVWDDHISGMQKLCQVLKYMVGPPVTFFDAVRDRISSAIKDRVYTKAANVPLIWDAGLESFLKHIIRPPIKDHLITAILRLIYLEREGHPVNRSAVQGCVSVLLVLNVGSDGSSVYKVDLEPLVLQESNSYYEAEGKRLLETCNASEYLRRVSRLKFKLD
jgi:cullin 3